MYKIYAILQPKAISYGVVYLVGNDGILYGRRINRCTDLAVNNRLPIVSSTSVANGVIYIGTRNRTLYAIVSIFSADVLPHSTNPTPTPTPSPSQTQSSNPNSAPAQTVTPQQAQQTPSTLSPTPNPTSGYSFNAANCKDWTANASSAFELAQLWIIGGVGFAVVIGSFGFVRYKRKLNALARNKQ